MEFKDTKIKVVSITPSVPLGDNKRKPTKIDGEDGIQYSCFHDHADDLKAGDVIQATGKVKVKGQYTNYEIEDFTILENAPQPTVVNNNNNGTDWERKDELAHRRAVMDTLIASGCYNRKDGNLDREALQGDFDWAMSLVYARKVERETVAPPVKDVEEPTTAYGWFVKLTADIGWDNDDRARFIHGIYPKCSWKELTEEQKEDVVKAVRKEVEVQQEIPF